MIQLLEFTAKQLKVRGANRDRTQVIPYFRTTEAGDTVAWYLHYPDGSEEVVPTESVPLDKQKKADGMMIWAIAEKGPNAAGMIQQALSMKAELLSLAGIVMSVNVKDGTFEVQKCVPKKSLSFCWRRKRTIREQRSCPIDGTQFR